MGRRPAVGVGLIIKKGGSILLGERKKKYGKGLLSLPGGHIEMYEHSETAGRRETLEECGLEVGLASQIGFTEDIDQKSKKHYITIYYLAEYIGGEPKNLEPEKTGDWEWYKISELKKHQGKIWSPCLTKFKELGWIK